MDAVVFCGGRGTRFAADVEKPLYPVGGEPMVDRVVDALRASDVEGVHAAVSSNAPATREHLDGRVPLVETPGEGYVPDLDAALDAVGRPALTVAADLPLLAAGPVDRVLAAHDGGALTACVPAALKRALGVSVDTTLADGDLAPTGVNVVGVGTGSGRGGGEEMAEAGAPEAGPAESGPADTEGPGRNRSARWVCWDPRLAVNVNRRSDAAVAERLCRAADA